MKKILRNAGLTLCAVVGLSINSDNANAIFGLDRAMSAVIDDLPYAYGPNLDGGIYHRVEPRESLWAIAEFYFGDGRKWPKLARINDISAPYIIQPGERILITNTIN